jgi:hypothetical protein
MFDELPANLASGGKNKNPERRIRREERRGQADRSLSCPGGDADDRRLAIDQTPMRYRGTQRTKLWPAPAMLTIQEHHVLCRAPIEVRHCGLHREHTATDPLIRGGQRSPVMANLGSVHDGKGQPEAVQWAVRSRHR